MPRVNLAELQMMQHNASNIRNICILAHVDHGKTSLSDTLLATNGIISERLSGSVWFLDYLPEEQRRGITMKSSAISLVHSVPKPGGGFTKYLINLVDSPGHVDFSGEVSGAVRVTDGALLLVDVIEGVCIQTRVVLQQAIREKLKLILVFTKMDKFIINAKLEPAEAFEKLTKILAEINALAADILLNGKLDTFGSSNKPSEEKETEESSDDGTSHESDEYFSPEKGNVIFSCSSHHWAFRTIDFAKMYAAKFGMSESVLKKTLWGNYYIDAVHKRVTKKPVNAKQVPAFVQLVLKPIWDTYNAVETGNRTVIEKMTKVLNITDPAVMKDVYSSDKKLAVSSLMSRWIGIGNVVLDSVVELVPSPLEAQEARFDALVRSSESMSDTVSMSLKTCSSKANDPVLAYVIKLFNVSSSDYNNSLRGYRRRVRKTEEGSQEPDTGDDGQGGRFIAVARVFSGVLKPGSTIYVLGAKYDPKDPHSGVESAVVDQTFLLMGQSLEPIDEVPAGNICGISGLGKAVFKTATLSSSLETRPLRPLWSLNDKPIVRVAVEPRDAHQTEQLVAGLRRLNQADPMCRTLVQETGEHVVVASGELHLERCINDLRDIYARIEINVSEPIVPFRETVVALPAGVFAAPVCEKRLSSGRAVVSIQAVPLPDNVTELLESSQDVLSSLSGNAQVDVDSKSKSEFEEKLKELFHQAGEQWESLYSKIWSFGPHRIGPNILFNATESVKDWKPFFGSSTSDCSEKTDEKSALEGLETSVVTGFDIAVASGPLAGEPVRGVGFIVRDFRLLSEEEAALTETKTDEGFSQEDYDEFQPGMMSQDTDFAPSSTSQFEEDEAAFFTPETQASTDMEGVSQEDIDAWGPMETTETSTKDASDLKIIDTNSFASMSGQLISLSCDACKGAFAACGQRLVEPMYRCEVQVSSQMLGKMYAVLHRRRAKILNEEIREGSSTFIISANLPVVESFGFAEEILTKTSGEAIPQLVFDKFELLDIDPFFVPTTKEEIEEFGDGNGGMAPNIALNYIQQIRKRKGLPTMTKLVEHADKQRTRSKKR